MTRVFGILGVSAIASIIGFGFVACDSSSAGDGAEAHVHAEGEAEHAHHDGENAENKECGDKCAHGDKEGCGECDGECDGGKDCSHCKDGCDKHAKKGEDASDSKASPEEAQPVEAPKGN